MEGRFGQDLKGGVEGCQVLLGKVHSWGGNRVYKVQAAWNSMTNSIWEVPGWSVHLGCREGSSVPRPPATFRQSECGEGRVSGHLAAWGWESSAREGWGLW